MLVECWRCGNDGKQSLTRVDGPRKWICKDAKACAQRVLATLAELAKLDVNQDTQPEGGGSIRA